MGGCIIVLMLILVVLVQSKGIAQMWYTNDLVIYPLPQWPTVICLLPVVLPTPVYLPRFLIVQE